MRTMIDSVIVTTPSESLSVKEFYEKSPSFIKEVMVPGTGQLVSSVARAGNYLLEN